MTRTPLLLAATFAAVAFGTTGGALAQSKEGYWTQPAGGNAVWKSGAGLCWRAGYWTPAMAIAECDPDLVPKPAPKPVAAPPPPPKVAPPPPPPPPKPAAAPPKPKVLVVNSTELFEFDKAVLSDAAKSKLDTEVIAKLRDFATIQFIEINGHTDRLGSPQYNQKLSERRADAVKDYLISKGVDASKITAFGWGKTGMNMIAPMKSCPDERNRKALIACLAPNRRVEVQVRGTAK